MLIILRTKFASEYVILCFNHDHMFPVTIMKLLFGVPCADITIILIVIDYNVTSRSGGNLHMVSVV